jgi:hypothetical protein
MGVRLLAIVLLCAPLANPFEKEGNFGIRFEPMAVLQAGVPVPFHIHVEDALHKPVTDAKVTLQIETAEHKEVQKFKAPGIGEGVYVAKPVFPEAGEWNVLVEVYRDDQVSARSITYEVADAN